MKIDRMLEVAAEKIAKVQPELADIGVGVQLFHGTKVENDFEFPRGPAWFTDSYEVADEFGQTGDEPTVKILGYTVKKRVQLLKFPKYEQLFRWINRAYGEDIENTYKAARFIHDWTKFPGWILTDAYRGGLINYDRRGPLFSDVMLCEPELWLEPQ